MKLPPILLLVALLGACSTIASEPKFGPATPMQGTYSSNFEMAVFNGCDPVFVGEAPNQFAERTVSDPSPKDIATFRAFRIEVVGQRTVGNKAKGRGYGLMGMLPCQIEIEQVYSVAPAGDNNVALKP